MMSLEGGKSGLSIVAGCQQNINRYLLGYYQPATLLGISLRMTFIE